MRMLYLYRGWNSGTNQAVLNAWQAGSPEIEIAAHDVNARAMGGVRSVLAALPVALRRGGIRVLMPGTGRFADATKRSMWYMNRIASEVERLQRSDRFDFSLAIGTLTPNLRPRQPHFIYTDLTIRANAYYPLGDERLKLWRDCIACEAESLSKATMIFTMSDHITRSLIEQYGLSPDKVVRVNGGINSPPAGQSDPSRYERQNILFLGVQWELKGGPQLVEAFVKVRRLRPQATLTIVGCSPTIPVEGVRVVGRVPQEQVPKFLGEASLLCMVSRREAFGIAYIEAMHAGLPVIASDLGATPDFVINGRTGYRVNPDDVDELASRLDELLGDPDKCRRMGEQARALAQSQYTWENTQQKMYRAVCGVLGASKEHEGMPCR